MSRQPNIILFFSDQHNANVMGNAGNPYILTPNMDKLARRGTSMTNCYCNSPLCVPSRSSMLSGQYPSDTGVYHNRQCLRSDRATFVTALSVAGYETVLSGRMHFVGYDQRHGFEKRLVGDITPSFFGIADQDRQYGILKGTPNQSIVGIEKSGAGSSSVFHFDREVVNQACGFLQQRDDDRPLFMTIGLFGPHAPFVAPKEQYDYYFNKLPEPDAVSDAYKNNVHPAIQQWYKNRGVHDVSAGQIRRVRAAYYGVTSIVDHLLGQALDAIEATIGLDNTIILYASDHGDNIGENGLFWKSNFYEGAVRVPLIISWKDRIRAGNQIRGLTSLIDLAPTLLEFAGAPQLPGLRGESLVRNLTEGADVEAQRTVISQLCDIKGDSPSAMIRAGAYKYVHHYGYDTPQLFNLQEDPREQHDLGGDPSFAHIADRMKEQLDRHWNADEVYNQLQYDHFHARLMEKWVKAASVQPIEEWYPQPHSNYLI